MKIKKRKTSRSRNEMYESMDFMLQLSNNTLCQLQVLFVKSPSMAMNMILILIVPQPSTHAIQFMNNQ